LPVSSNETFATLENQEPAAPGELQHVGIALPVAADPDVVARVDLQPVVGGGPGVLVARSAERVHQVALRIELQDVRGRLAADRVRLVRSDVPLVARVQALAAVHDEHVVAGVDADPDRVAEQPVIRQRLGPERIDLEEGDLDHVGLHGLGFVVDDGLADGEPENQRREDGGRDGLRSHESPPVESGARRLA
jgi:hypothetical protein